MEKGRKVMLIQCVPINGIPSLLGSHLPRLERASGASPAPYCPVSANKVALTAGHAH